MSPVAHAPSAPATAAATPRTRGGGYAACSG